jgi:hypothetical protein
MTNFPESDWKVFRRVREAALQRFCRRILDEVAQLAGGSEQNSHEQYLKLYRLIDKRDDEVARAFNDFRRSTALGQICLMKRYNMLTDEELSQFSQQTRQLLNDLFRVDEG